MAAPSLVSAIAVSENVLQLTFSQPVYFSGLLDIPDASSRKRYTLTPQPGSYGMDGTLAKPLGVASVQQVQTPNTYLGQVLNLTTDRPMTPNPAQYTVQCNGLFGLDRVTPLNPSGSSLPFTSTFKLLQPPQIETIAPRGDVANPQTLEGITAGLTPNPQQISLGSFVVNAGDYATETGLVAYKARLYRRMITAVDGFLHLAGKNYGAGLLQYGKKLGSSSIRAQLLAAIEQQAGLEPETAAVAAKSTPNNQNPGEMFIVLMAKTKFGQSLKLVAPVNVSS